MTHPDGRGIQVQTTCKFLSSTTSDCLIRGRISFTARFSIPTVSSYVSIREASAFVVKP